MGKQMRVKNVTYEIPAQKRINPNDREMVLTKVDDGLWIHIDGHNNFTTTDDATALQKSIILIDTANDDVKVHIWGHPDVEDPTDVIELKRSK